RERTLALAIYVRAFAIESHKPPLAKVEREPLPPHPTLSPKSGGEGRVRGKPVPAPPAHMSSAQIYRAYCMSCHDKDGRGNTIRKGMPEIPDFSDAKWQKSRKDGDIQTAIL